METVAADRRSMVKTKSGFREVPAAALHATPESETWFQAWGLGFVVWGLSVQGLELRVCGLGFVV